MKKSKNRRESTKIKILSVQKMLRDGCCNNVNCNNNECPFGDDPYRCKAGIEGGFVPNRKEYNQNLIPACLKYLKRHGEKQALK